MPNPQTPLAKAKLTGAMAKNPQRFRDRSAPASSGASIGKPPAYLGKRAKAVWSEFVDQLGWLEFEDRMALESASVAIGQMRELVAAGEVINGAMFSAINTAIGKLGASPTDRGKVFQVPDEDDKDDPFARFDGKAN